MWNQGKPDMTGASTFDDQIQYTRENIQHAKDAIYTGWNPALTAAGAAQTWAYLSSSSIRIADAVDYSSLYVEGTKFKITQVTGGTKYFRVASASYSAPNFDITLESRGVYTVANEAITNPNFSFAFQPAGYPNWTEEDIQNLQAEDTALQAQITNGWVPLSQTCTYGSADDPTYVFTVAANLTSIIAAGMRFRCSQTTGGAKYFIITKVEYSAPNTTVTIFGGTGANSYDLANESISSPCFSMMYAPFGFNPDPDIWSVSVLDTSDRTSLGVSAGVWTNVGTTNSQITVPIGLWDAMYSVAVSAAKTSAGTGILPYTALSTANNSASDNELVAFGGMSGMPSSTYTATVHVYKQKRLSLSVKTTYYLNAQSNTIADLSFKGSVTTTVIRAICAYL